MSGTDGVSAVEKAALVSVFDEGGRAGGAKSRAVHSGLSKMIREANETGDAYETTVPAKKGKTGESTDDDGGVRLESGGRWQDAALVASNGRRFEHAFRNAGVASVVRRAVLRPQDADPDVAFASEIAVYATGRHHRDCTGFSVYWHSHSELVFALTGVTYCTRIYVQCGRRCAGGVNRLFRVPHIYITLNPDGMRPDAGFGRPIVWPRDVSVAVSSRANHEMRVLKVEESLRRYVELGSQREESSISSVLSGTGSNIGADFTVVSDPEEELPLFVGMVSVTYARLDSESLPIAAKMILNAHGAVLERRRLRLTWDTNIREFFLTQVCVYLLGDDDNAAESLMGVLYSRAATANLEFRLHRDVLQTSREIAAVLNYFRDNQDRLAEHEERPDNGDDAHFGVVRQYYSRSHSVMFKTLATGKAFLDAFVERRSVQEALRKMSLDYSLSASAASREDIVAILRC